MCLWPPSEACASSPHSQGHEKCPCYHLFCSVLLPIQPKVCMTKVYFPVTSVGSQTPLDSGSRLAIAELLRAPDSVLPCVSSSPISPAPGPPALPLLSGLCNSPPSQWSSTGLAVPPSTLPLGREGTHGRGSRHPYRRNVRHFPFVAAVLVILGRFLWHSSRTL